MSFQHLFYHTYIVFLPALKSNQIENFWKEQASQLDEKVLLKSLLKLLSSLQLVAHIVT